MMRIVRELAGVYTLKPVLGLARTEFAAPGAAISLVALSAAATGAPLSPDTIWTPEARASAPVWVQIWIGFMFVVFGAGLVLAWKHRAAWWMVGAFVGSHLASGLEILLLGPERLTVGLIAINHCVFWTPAAVAFYRRTRGTRVASVFGLWRWLVLATAAFSLIFDYRDAVLLLAADWR